MLAQSRKPDSILIVDNASSDETEAFCCELMKERKEIEYLRLLENTGGAGGFYTGIKVAIKRGADYTGEWMTMHLHREKHWRK